MSKGENKVTAIIIDREINNKISYASKKSEQSKELVWVENLCNKIVYNFAKKHRCKDFFDQVEVFSKIISQLIAKEENAKMFATGKINELSIDAGFIIPRSFQVSEYHIKSIVVCKQNNNAKIEYMVEVRYHWKLFAKTKSKHLTSKLLEYDKMLIKQQDSLFI
jgi:hypothetical protein